MAAWLLPQSVLDNSNSTFNLACLFLISPNNRPLLLAAEIKADLIKLDLHSLQNNHTRDYIVTTL